MQSGRILEDPGSPGDPGFLRELGILGETRIPVVQRRPSLAETVEEFV